LLGEMCASNIHDTDVVLMSLLRQAAGGDMSQPNMWLVDALIKLFTAHQYA